jgi:hypothetical protein
METFRAEAPYESHFAPRRNPTLIQAIALMPPGVVLDSAGSSR